MPKETTYAYEFCRHYSHVCEMEDDPAPYPLALEFIQSLLKYSPTRAATILAEISEECTAIQQSKEPVVRGVRKDESLVKFLMLASNNLSAGIQNIQ